MWISGLTKICWTGDPGVYRAEAGSNARSGRARKERDVSAVQRQTGSAVDPEKACADDYRGMLSALSDIRGSGFSRDSPARKVARPDALSSR